MILMIREPRLTVRKPSYVRVEEVLMFVFSETQLSLDRLYQTTIIIHCGTLFYLFYHYFTFLSCPLLQILIPINISTHTNDIGHCVGRILKPSEIFRFLKATWQPESCFVFSATQQAKQQRKFQKDWLHQFHWLACSHLKKGGLCKFCVLFALPTASAGKGIENSGEEAFAKV